MHRKLKALRQLNGLTQEDTAKLLGLSLHTYNNKENNRTKFSLDEAKKIADLFKTTVDDIFFNDCVPITRTNASA